MANPPQPEHPAPPESTNRFSEFIKRIWAPIAGIIDAVLLANQFVDIWKGNNSQTVIVTSAVVFLIWILFWLWIGYGKATLAPKTSLPFEKYIPGQITERAAMWVLALSVLGGVIGGLVLLNHARAEMALREQKTIILIAAFDGPEEKYGIRNEIVEQLETRRQPAMPRSKLRRLMRL